MAILFLLIAFRMVFRRPRVAAAAVVVLFALLTSSQSEYPWIAMIINSVQLIILLAVLLRLGLFAAIATHFFQATASTYFPVTADLSAWYAPASMFACGVLLLLAVYGFRISLAAEPFAVGRPSTN
jgi:hypothetical protein